jgi:hypothetical protein
MELTLAKMRNDGEKEPEETTSRIWAELPVEEWGHLPKFTFLSPEFFLYKGNAGTKMEQRLEKKKKKKKKERHPETCPTWDQSHAQAANPDTITDATLCLQTGA